MLTSGVSDEQVKGLKAMFDITFLNEKMLLDYVIEFFVKKKPITIENNTESTKTKPASSKELELEPLNTKKNDKKSNPFAVKKNTYPFALEPLKNKNSHNSSPSFNKPLKNGKTNIQKIIFVCILLLIGFLYYQY
jgi:hypothetical protein